MTPVTPATYSEPDDVDDLDDLRLLAANASTLLSRADEVLANPAWASAPVAQALIGDHLGGEQYLSLGALLALWRDGTLAIPGPEDSPTYIARAGGSVLSGAHQLVCIDPLRGELLESTLPADTTFGHFRGELKRRLAGLARPDESAPSLREVIEQLGGHPVG